MDERERYLKTLLFEKSDRIPRRLIDVREAAVAIGWTPRPF